MEKYCRLCAKDDKKPLVSILGNPLSITEKLKKLLQIQVSEESKLPQTICLECLTKLNQFNDFFTTSTENQFLLEIIFGTDDCATSDQSNDEAALIEVKQQPKENYYIIEECAASDDYNEDFVEASERQLPGSEYSIELSSRVNKTRKTELNVSEALRGRRKFAALNCYVCNQHLAGNKALQEHFSSKHPRDELHYVCPVCFKHQTKYRSYTRHAESHEEKRFSCDICGKRFLQKITLIQHISTHSNLRKFKCEDCHLEFKQNSSLFKHRHTKHSNALPICLDCGNVFASNETLMQHRRSKHNVEKEIVCQSCAKTFASRAALDYHRKAEHKSGKRHVCDGCEKSFKTSVILKRHIKKSH